MPAQEHLGDQFKDFASPADVPPEFGTTSIPAGMMRFHHYTGTPETARSIKQSGLLRSHSEASFARGGTESPDVFATAGSPNDNFKRSHVFVEGYANPSRGADLDIGENWRDADLAEHIANVEGRRNTITARGDIPAGQILHVHEPWHETFRSLSERPGPHSQEKSIMAGDYDRGYDPETNKAISATKIALAAKVMLGGQLQGRTNAEFEEDVRRRRAAQK
jgi:hypothetical protein